MKLLCELLPKELVKQNEPMINHTSFKIGGAADYLVTPETKEQLTAVISAVQKNGIKYFVIGNGSNLLVSDSGIRGIVIKTTNLTELTITNCRISAGSGILLSKLASQALKSSLSGLEFAHGIPGTLGGGIVMNAGAYGGELKDVVVSTEYIDDARQLRCTDSHDFSYRQSIFTTNPNWVVLGSVLQLKNGEQSAIKSRMDELSLARRSKQPVELPSAGSVFKRPEGYFAGKLIEDCGLRGFSIGGAQISEKHCGFIVNKGGATAGDVRRLIEHIQNQVMNSFGVKLETEIKYIGD